MIVNMLMLTCDTTMQEAELARVRASGGSGESSSRRAPSTDLEQQLAAALARAETHAAELATQVRHPIPNEYECDMHDVIDS
jgi:hypothetical protein